jgi:hypothetical protein
MIHVQTLHGAKNTLLISEFPKGLYFLRLIADDNRHFEIKKLVIN